MTLTATAHTIRPVSGAAIGAFFDVDNTLVPGAAIEFRFFCYLFQRRLVGMSEAISSLAYLMRHMPPVSLQPLRERKLYLAGKATGAIEPIAHDFVRREICPRIAPEAVARLDSHRQAGHRLVLLTGSLDFLIAPLAAFLNVETVIAARPERKDARYTGHVVPPLPYGEGKRHLVHDLARRDGICLPESFAYGDSPGDVALLQAVGHPLVVNPIRGMDRIARQHGWKVVNWT
jgi:HAD superfamily hydrolase (TIGR01490 family)